MKWHADETGWVLFFVFFTRSQKSSFEGKVMEDDESCIDNRGKATITRSGWPSFSLQTIFDIVNRYSGVLRHNSRMFTTSYTYRSIGAVRHFLAQEIRPCQGWMPMVDMTYVLCQAVRAFDPEFEFTTIQVNKNFAGLLHVDGSNRGRTLMLTLGHVSGGDLWIYPGNRVKTAWKWVEFDGRIPHCTYPFEGDRISIVYYTHSMWENWHSTLSDMQHLWELGFNLPTDVCRSSKPTGRKNRNRIDDACKVLPPELAMRIPDHVAAGTSFAPKIRMTAEQCCLRESELLRVRFARKHAIKRQVAPSHRMFINDKEYEKALLSWPTLCAHRSHIGDRVVNKSTIHSHGICFACEASRRAPDPVCLPTPPLSWLSSHRQSKSATSNETVLLDLPCFRHSTAKQWHSQVVALMLQELADKKHPKTRIPKRGEFISEEEFREAVPLRACTMKEHVGKRVMEFTPANFTSSNGRLTHCRQCKRRYTALKRSQARNCASA